MRQRTAREGQTSTRPGGLAGRGAQVGLEGPAATTRHSHDAGEEVVPLGFHRPNESLVCGNFVSIRGAQ